MATSVLARPGDRALSEVIARVSDPASLANLQRQGEQCGWCAHPIRLIGNSVSVDTATGEILRSYSTNDEPDGVLMKACGTRRATRCPSCAALYASDARMLVRAGMSGGKGVPESVSQHPMVFATFTAPSFGPVHSAHGGQVCHVSKGPRTCRHGASASCHRHHREGDEVVGSPLCPDCYDYEQSVLWNATCPELWRRTTIYVRRELARLCDMNVKELDRSVRLSFAKVAEFQRRGVVHLHAILRVDPRDDEASVPRSIDAQLLTSAIRAAGSKVSAPLPRGFSGTSLASARWGRQLDVRVINAREVDGDASVSGESRRSSRAVANYVAKYATKSTDDLGALDRRLTSLDDLDARNVSAHFRRLVTTAWQLGALTHLSKLRTWAHSLGFGGHWLTKSRRYSVTFKFLRAERQAWQVQRQRGTAPNEQSINVGVWKWIGTGWRTLGDAWLASQGQREKMQSRTEVREARCIERRSSADPWDERPRHFLDVEAVEP
ncbi:MAG: replication initiator [Acidimicrobiales bacterium]